MNKANEIQTITAEIKTAYVTTLEESIAKVNKHLAKYNQPLVVITDRKDTIHVNIQTLREVSWTLVTVAYPAFIHNGRNVNYVGTVTLDTGTKKIHSIDPRFVLGAIDHKTLKCDHCHKVRNRASWSFFEENGSLLHIGKACSKDYFGVAVDHLLVFLSDLNDMSGSDNDERYGGSKNIPSASIRDLVTAIFISTNGFKGYVSKSKSNPELNVISTGSKVLGWLFPDFRNMSHQEKEDYFLDWNNAKEASAKIAEEVPGLLLALPAPTTDFEWNVRNALFDADGSVLPFVVFFGPAIYGIFSAYFKAHEVVVAKADEVNEFVGAEGDKVEAKVTVLKAQWIDSNYGGSMLYVLQDDAGHSFKTFYSGQEKLDQGSTYTIKGTVKKHDVYQGKKSTVLTRIKVLA